MLETKLPVLEHEHLREVDIRWHYKVRAGAAADGRLLGNRRRYIRITRMIGDCSRCYELYSHYNNR